MFGISAFFARVSAAIGPEFPPKGRLPTGLKPLQVEVSGADRTLRLDPDALTAAVLGGELDLGPAFKDSASLISGGPAYRYRDCEVDLLLGGAELARFVARDLAPHEYRALRDRYGIFFMIHGDFYDSRTGRSCQPLRSGGTADDMEEDEA